MDKQEAKNLWGIFWKAGKEAHREFWAPLTAFWKELTKIESRKTRGNHHA